MRTTTFDAGAVELHVLLRRGSPTLLLLHGLAGYGGEWEQVCHRLNDTVGIIAPDQRAHGRSWNGIDVDVDTQDYVRDAVALIERWGEGRVIVVGQSMGGIVATLVAAERPDLVDQLVLIEAGIRPMTATEFEALEHWLGRWPDRFADADEAATFFGEERRSTSAWVAGLEETTGGLVPRFEPRAMLETMRSLGASDRAVQWRQISVPTTLVVAEESAIGHDEIDDMIASRPETQVVEVAGSGHDVHLDRPEVVASVLTVLVEGIA
jgi:pimeloyl-ACP methyl ester carboxylesterase